MLSETSWRVRCSPDIVNALSVSSHPGPVQWSDLNGKQFDKFSKMEDVEKREPLRTVAVSVNQRSHYA